MVRNFQLILGKLLRIVSYLFITSKTYNLFAGEMPGNFDVIIENDDLEKAYEILRNFILTNYNPQYSAGELSFFRY